MVAAPSTLDLDQSAPETTTPNSSNTHNLHSTKSASSNGNTIEGVPLSNTVFVSDLIDLSDDSERTVSDDGQETPVAGTPVPDVGATDFGRSWAGSRQSSLDAWQDGLPTELHCATEALVPSRPTSAASHSLATGTGSDCTSAATRSVDSPLSPAATATSDSIAPPMDEQAFEGIANGHSSGTDMPPDRARLSPATSSMRKVASSTAAYHRRNGSFPYEQRRPSFSSDLDNMSGVSADMELHSEIAEITTQVTSISNKLTQLEEANLLSGENQSRLKQENAVLQERLHGLEESLHNTEERWKEKCSEERQRHRETVGRLEREKQLELETVQLRLDVLQRDADKAQENAALLRTENARLAGRLSRAEQQLAEAAAERDQLQEEKHAALLQYKSYKEESEAEMATSSDMVEELAKQNDELRRNQVKRRSGSVVERAVELEEELSVLRRDYNVLMEQNGELHAQLVETGRSLLAAPSSLAAELHGKDKEELINALKEQEVCNQKLRIYIEGILTRVIEKHPDILEIGNAQKPNV